MPKVPRLKIIETRYVPRYEAMPKRMKVPNKCDGAYAIRDPLEPENNKPQTTSASQEVNIVN
jgi:hypothetical protein